MTTLAPSSSNGNGRKLQPPQGSQTAAQTPMFPFGGAGGAMTWLSPGYLPLGPGGTFNNPLNFPGWGNYYYGVSWVYDWMLRHPRIQQARSIVQAPVIACPWLFECDDGLDKKRDAIADNWNDLRACVVPDALRGMDYGCAKFEPVWQVNDDGLWYVAELKPLDVDRTGIIVDYDGSFLGFSVALRTDQQGKDYAVIAGNAGEPRPNLPAANGKAWLYTYDKKNGNLHGRSRFENIRETAWIPWLTTAQQLILMGGKLSGRQAYAIVPPGKYTFNGTDRTYAQDAQDALLAWLEGKNPIFTSLALEALDAGGAVDPDLKVKLAGESLVKFNTVDFGNLGPAVDAKLAELQHYEDLMFAGMLRSSRTGMESKHGSRADAEQHTDTGATDSQIVADAIASAAQCLIDFQCKLNWNLPPGSVRIKAAPLQDKEAEAANANINTFAQNKDVGKILARKIDWEKQFAAAKIPTDPKVNVNDLLKEDANKPPPQPFAPGAKPLLPQDQLSDGTMALSRLLKDAVGSENDALMNGYLAAHDALARFAERPQPEIRIENKLPRQRAPKVKVENRMPQQPAPVVNVDVAPAPVSVPAPVIQVNMPEPAKTVKRVERDADGNVERIVEE